MKKTSCLMALLLSSSALAGPVDNFTAQVNSTITANGQGGITGAKLNFALLGVVPVFTSMGTWDSNGVFTVSGSGTALTGITPAQVGAVSKTGDSMSGSLSLPAPALFANNNTADTTANSQNRLSRVANNAVLAAWTNTAFPVERDGFAAPGDGGRARYNWSSAACSQSTPDQGTQVSAGGGGCWNIDWGSVNGSANAFLFGFVGNGAATSATDTAAIQAALNTGRDVIWPDSATFAVSGSTGFIVNTPGQRIHGAGRWRSRINVPAGFSGPIFSPGGSTLSSATTANAFLGGQQGPTIEGIGAFYTQPSAPPSSASGLNQYGAMFNFQNVPRFHVIDVGCYAAWICVDARGNTGDSDIKGLRYSSFSPAGGIQIDGALDAIRITEAYMWPAGLPGSPGAYYPLFFDTSTNGPLAIDIGRDDGFYLRDGLFICGRSLNFHSGTYPYTYGGDGNTGPSTVGTDTGLATISNIDFDGRAAVSISGNPTLKFMGNDHTIGGTTHYSVSAFGGLVSFVNEQFFVGVSTNNPPLNIQGAKTVVSGSLFNTLAFDVQSIIIGSGSAVVAGNLFTRPPASGSAKYTKPTISKAGGRLVASGNFENDVSVGGIFIDVPTVDASDAVTGNSSPGMYYNCGSGNNNVPPSSCPSHFSNNW